MDYETKEQSAAFLSFSLSHDASKHDVFACVIYACTRGKVHLIEITGAV